LGETGLFRDFPFRESILRDIEAAGYERPTPVQAECIPPALEGRDVIGLAQTGTGKTAAFALPIIQKFAGRQEMCALVLAPTRELAAQIGVMFKQLGHSSGVHAAVVVGGVPIEKDFKALRNWPTVLIATPGRLIDHIRSHTVSLKDIEVLVIDEADRMHDMGFIPQVRRILDALPVERQTLIFTATLPDDVERIVRQNMRSPVRVQVGRRSAPAERAEQKLFQVHEEQKTPLLLEMLREGDGRILVFVRTKRRVDKLARAITGRCGRVARIHGDREQNQRDDAMGGFREGRYRILIATDIAARGIDVADIEHVINYDFPLSPEDYVHRIGRTARVEASGTATSFVTGADRKCVAALERLIGKKLPVTLSNVAAGAAPALEPRRGRHSRRRRRETGPHDVRRASHRN
jgi:ATP-dependent RNA helicase RhlE